MEPSTIHTEWHQIIGVIGTVIYISTYFLVQISWIKAPGYSYCLLNIMAASLVGISLLFEFNLASALIQASWILISIIGITKLVYNNKSKRKRRRRRSSGSHYYKPDDIVVG